MDNRSTDTLNVSLQKTKEARRRYLLSIVLYLGNLVSIAFDQSILKLQLFRADLDSFSVKTATKNPTNCVVMMTKTENMNQPACTNSLRLSSTGNELF